MKEVEDLKASEAAAIQGIHHLTAAEATARHQVQLLHTSQAQAQQDVEELIKSSLRARQSLEGLHAIEESARDDLNQLQHVVTRMRVSEALATKEIAKLKAKQLETDKMKEAFDAVFQLDSTNSGSDGEKCRLQNTVSSADGKSVTVRVSNPELEGRVLALVEASGCEREERERIQDELESARERIRKLELQQHQQQRAVVVGCSCVLS